jgi:hypothetical protein
MSLIAAAGSGSGRFVRPSVDERKEFGFGICYSCLLRKYITTYGTMYEYIDKDQRKHVRHFVVLQ